MKFRLTFKTPDVIDQLPDSVGPSSTCDICQGVARIVDKYLKYEECITVEGDTETGDMIVVPNA